MQASRTPLALFAFAAGVLVALGASWLLNVGESNSAYAQERDEARRALAVAEKNESKAATERADAPIANAPTSFESATRTEAESRSPLQVASNTRTNNGGPHFNLDASIAKLYEDNPEQFLELLCDQLIKDGDPMRALELLQDNPHSSGQLFSSVGDALVKSGQTAGAIKAYTASVKLDPMYSDSFDSLLELDPSTALMMIREGLDWQPPPGNPGLRTRLAEALLAAGQEEEATKLVEELRASGHKANSLTRLFSKMSPEAAEAELRASVDGAVGKKKTGPLQRLASMLQEAGRTEEARATLDTLLELNPGNTRARRMLMELDSAAAVEFLEARTAAEPKSASLWADYGSSLEAEGRRVDAIEAWERAVSINGNNAAVGHLIKHSPDTVWTNLETFTQQSGDDERWGDFGDLLWQNNRNDEAKRAWEKAWELDPSDGEWYGKLQAIQVGRDPLG